MIKLEAVEAQSCLACGSNTIKPIPHVKVTFISSFRNSLTLCKKCTLELQKLLNDNFKSSAKKEK